MNAPATRIQLFAVLSLSAIMLLCGMIYVALTTFSNRAPEPAIVGGHGIETTWPSARGENRLWSISSGARDPQLWIDEHIAMLDVAQRAMPPAEKR